MQPLIDVLIPAYNAGWSLPETLASIQAQTVRNIRVIVVDDGSTDNTAAVLAAAAALDTRIHVITQANGGIVAALNAGLAACTAPLIARHDADDLSDPDRFERQMRYLDGNPDCVAVAGAARHINQAGRDLGTRTRLRDPALANPFSIPATEPYLLQPMLMVRTESFHAAGGYRPLLISEDTDLYWRLQKFGRLHNLTEPLGEYRMHEGSITSQSIVTGRQGAFCAQLAAVSAQRRARSEPDIVFDLPLFNAIKQAKTLAQLYEIGCQHLIPVEQNWLALSVSAKLVELCFYRPFEPSADDCCFIRAALKTHSGIMTPNNRAVLRESLVGTSVRLALKGLIVQALLLAFPKLMPMVMLRMAFRVILPNALRDWIKKSVGRGNPAAPPIIPASL
ncbi:MAG: glycosyltransferase family 2 protein [Janthinobacterium lividum]